MKSGGKKLGASKTQPCTGCGDKGIQNYMKGKSSASAAFMKMGRDKKISKTVKKK